MDLGAAERGWSPGAGEAAEEEAETDRFLRIIVSNFLVEPVDLEVDVQFLAALADQAGFPGFAGFPFSAGKLPGTREMPAGGTLGDEQSAIAEDQGGADVDDGWRRRHGALGGSAGGG